MTRYLHISMICLAFMCNSACANTPTKWVQPTVRNVTPSLYFKGLITPGKKISVITKVNGTVIDAESNVGLKVQKGDVLVRLNTNTDLSAYRSAKSAYLNSQLQYQKFIAWRSSSEYINAMNGLRQAKQGKQTAVITHQQNIDLYKYKAISKQELDQSKLTLDNANNQVIVAQQTLSDLHQRNTGTPFVVSKLELKNSQDKYLSLKKALEAATIKAPISGIILRSNNTDKNSNDDNNSNNDNTNILNIGQKVQAGNALFDIGSLQSIKIQINVSEGEINQIHLKQTVTVNSAGLPGISMQGVVTSISAQANSDSMNSVPQFPVIITVSNIPKAAKKLLKIGMDAKIGVITDKHPNALLIPLQAVHKDKKNKSFVIIRRPNSNKTYRQKVSTGWVGITQIEITSGLTQKNEVMLP